MRLRLYQKLDRSWGSGHLRTSFDIQHSAEELSKWLVSHAVKLELGYKSVS